MLPLSKDRVFTKEVACYNISSDYMAGRNNLKTNTTNIMTDAKVGTAQCNRYGYVLFLFS